MNINRNNYEEYFILYLDNELPANLRAEVETFANAHADLKVELEMLLQTKLVPEEIIFDKKELLFKPEITENELEENLLLYIDNELNAEETERIEKIIASQPAARAEFESFSKVKLEIETIEFPDKSILYRHSEGRRVVAFNWKRLAIAAVLTLGLATAGTLLLKNNDTEPDAIVSGPGSISIKAGDETIPVNSTVQSETKVPVPNMKSEIADVNIKEGKNKPNNSEDRIIQSASEQKSFIANIDNNENGNNLPSPEENYRVNSISANANNISDVNLPSRKTLTSDPSITQQIAVTPSSLQPLYTSNVSSEPEEDTRQKGRKGGLRGFVRKITRTFEKTTDFEATDGDDRLLVAGLAIKL